MAIFINGGDRVAVLDEAFNQVFPFARPLSVRVNERSQLMDHTTETGQVITDYSIILPIEIDLSVIVEAENYRDTYEQIRTLYTTKQLLTVQTNTANYPDMVIADMPHEERTEIYDALPIALHFRQIQLVPDPSTYDPADPASADTQSLGQQNGYTITGVQTINGTETIPAGTTTYSSVPPVNSGIQASGVQTMNGVQTISVPTTENIPVTGVQTITSQQSLSQVLQ